MSGLVARLRGRRGAVALDVALEAPAGAVTALTGPSGAGKSTLLRAIAGLEPLVGDVRLGDEVWQDGGRFVPAHLRLVGFVFQHAALLPHMSVRANLDFGRRRAKAPVEALDHAVALMRLGPLLARRPDRLSGGERKRVALGRALATRPRLLLLDEPLSGLDEASKADLLPDLAAALAELAAPAVWVTHDAGEVARVASRVLHLREGRLVDPGTAAASPSLDALPPGEIRRLAKAALEAGL